MAFRFDRRAFLKAGASALGVAVLLGTASGRAIAKVAARVRPLLRPPGALPEKEFLKRCIRCARCAAVCPNTAIRMSGLSFGIRNLNTPRIAPREQACMLCMKCTQVCPTGALEPISADDYSVQTQVKMGRAVVDKSMCYSYQKRTCGVCIRACPFPGVAMMTGLYEQPIVTDACVGCGLCERACIHIPQAIRIVPVEA
ncbi:MAG: 4Fe-4S binding protein [Nitrospinaceae bacterium]|jgi:ferredoxin-type protein NapG|nr:4Fe-4S binding protein [Nitrospinaceae bacterium]MBT3434411.1 4Fe-4S binding protein [Nitrospinaceae bacterium]MBT3820148.1 4Fe-4S binding protein [Nitrospinaceae bacterium]MBT4092575.1 4Fe-4S binding protein [Nitrospinaceae bacterium]MBT4430056.1 4Fe-4S binding protein [Nitrospinaceae bacterium]